MKHKSSCLETSHCLIGAALVCCMLIVQGCVFVRGNVGEPFQDENVASITKGESTRENVTSVLGAPDEIVNAGGYEIFHYRRFDSKLGYLLFFSRLNISSDHVYVFFDSKGVVEELVYGKRTPELRFQVWPFGE